MMRRLDVRLLLTVLLLTVSLAEAQQPAKVPRIGYLYTVSSSSVAARTEAFRQGLRDLGYVERENILVEFRFADGKLDRASALAAEPVGLKVDIIGLSKAWDRLQDSRAGHN